jgi:hypothetical protein
MRSRSTTSGSFLTWMWIELMYSPRIPMKKSCTEAKKKKPMRIGAVPRTKRSQKTSLATR